METISNSDIEFWYVNGTSLNQYCFAVKTFGGTPRSVPVMRGGNIQVAYIPGQLYRPKFPDSRVITLLMWVAGIDPATDQPSSNPHLQFSDNLRTLQRLFYTPGTQISLTRQWYYTDPPNTGIPGGVPTLVAATALAEIGGTMEPTMTGPSRADLAVDLLLADPYFYGSAVTSNLALNVAKTVVNPGDDIAAYNNCSVTLHGPLQYPRVTNSTTLPNTWVQLNTVIASGDSVTIDVQNFNATRASDGLNLAGAVIHSGTKRWMVYQPGSNTLTLTSSGSSDSGSASVSFIPPYV